MSIQNNNQKTVFMFARSIQDRRPKEGIKMDHFMSMAGAILNKKSILRNGINTTSMQKI